MIGRTAASALGESIIATTKKLPISSYGINIEFVSIPGRALEEIIKERKQKGLRTLLKSSCGKSVAVNSILLETVKTFSRNSRSFGAVSVRRLKILTVFISLTVHPAETY